jgi:hypothetical protein
MHAGGTASSHLRGLQVRDAHQEDAEEAGGVWTVKDGVLALLEDFDRLEHALVAEVADAEAMEPCTLAEAKRRPDWPLWEKAIEEELATLKAAGTARSKYHRLQVGLQGKEGRGQEHRAIQGMASRPRVQPDQQRRL